eukprot:COSAG02_NODE_3269_length_7046_cov_7.506118_6_plen_112_part_00
MRDAPRGAARRDAQDISAPNSKSAIPDAFATYSRCTVLSNHRTAGAAAPILIFIVHTWYMPDSLTAHGVFVVVLRILRWVVPSTSNPFVHACGTVNATVDCTALFKSHTAP